MGGMGNQMFQAAYALALKHRGYSVQFDKSMMVEGTHREYSLDYFGTIAFGVPEGPQIYEKSLRYDPANLFPTDPCTMVGYWQTEKYFQTSVNVREVFKFKNPVPSLDRRIAVHVRRQDYVGLQHFHGMPDMDYYFKGIQYIQQQVSQTLGVSVFSDDPQWCRENFPKGCEVVEGNSKYDDMALMAAHDYHIIANSSFSWWGAYLGPQKLVVAPKQWFTTPTVDSTDLVPERWIKL